MAISVLKDSKLAHLEQYLSVFDPGTQAIFRSSIAKKLGRIPDAVALAAEAIRILEPEGPSASLYEAYMVKADLHADARQPSKAIEMGRAALHVAEDALATVPYFERESVRTLIARAVEFLLPIMLENATPENQWDSVNIAEHAKARSILETLGEDWLPVAGDLPPAARLEEVGDTLVPSRDKTSDASFSTNHKSAQRRLEGGGVPSTIMEVPR